MFPVPRRRELLGGAASTDLVQTTVDPSLPLQGYELLVRTEGASIRHRDALGLRYATQTLERLAAEPDVAAQRIVDHPDIAQRGYMLDVSRDRVPTNETLAWLVKVLAALRYTHLELYMEHTFAYSAHRQVWCDASPLTPEDIAWLDALCADNGIELVANQNTFGHMERWLRHDAYRGRAECPDGATSPFTGRPMAPSTLAPTPDNAEFALTLVRELTGHFASHVVNIGADEPFELGQGASAARVAEHGRAAVYLEHLDRLIRPLAAEGNHVLFWGDVLRRHPDLVARLPDAGSTAVVWNYEAPSPDGGLLAGLGPDLLDTLGLPDDAHRGFVAHVRSFVDTGYPFWVAPGTSTWNSLLGRWTNARDNVLDAATVGRSAGAGGFLLTDWGDNGHLQPLAVSLLPLAYGAGVAWCADTNAGHDPAPVVDALTGMAGLGALQAELGDAHLLSGVSSINGSALFAALDPTRPLPLIGRGTPDTVAETVALLDRALDWLATLGTGSGQSQPIGVAVDQERAEQIRLGLTAAVRLARQGAWRLAKRAGAVEVDDGLLASDLAECRELQAVAWLATSRVGGLEDSLRHIPKDPSG
ncbi:MAG: family 20 glycosylhydrolase [Actinomycetota bacterium]